MKRTKVLRFVLIAALLLSLRPAGAGAASPWSSYTAAQAAEKAGDLAGAITLYFDAAKGYASSNATNAALMYGHAGRLLAAQSRFDEAAVAWRAEAVQWGLAGGEQEKIAAERKADWVASEVRLFVAAPPEAVADRYDSKAKHEPVTGAYLGVYGERDPAVHDPSDGRPFYTEAFADAVGKQHPLFLLYGEWGDRLPQSHLNAIRAVNGALQWALQPTDGLAAVVDGPYLRSIAQEAGKSGLPIFLRFGGEMNGNWVLWHGDPALYKEKFRLVARVFREEAPNVAMLWAPGDFPPYTMAEYYPGDDAVDWVGLSAYAVRMAELDPVAPAGQGEDSRPLNDHFAEAYALYADRKPIMLAEGGIGYFDYGTGADRKEWALANIRRFYAAMPRLYPRVKALTWFDVDLGRVESRDQGIMKQNYRLTGDKQIMAAYQKATADPYYLSSLGSAAGQVYLDVAEAGIPPHRVELSSYVKAYDPFLTRVEYLVGGQVIGSSTAYDPWVVSADFSPYAGQEITLTVRAYGKSGQLAVERQIRARVGAVRVTLNGQTVAFDYQPRIEGSSTLVPIRHLATATGAAISASGGVITLTRGDLRIELTAGSTSARYGGSTVTLPVAPVIESGRTLVPLRVVEWLDLKVTWDPVTRTANLVTP